MCLSKLYSSAFRSNRFLFVFVVFLLFSFFFASRILELIGASGIRLNVLLPSKGRNSSFWCPLSCQWADLWACDDIQTREKLIIRLQNASLCKWGGGNNVRMLHFLPVFPTWSFHQCQLLLKPPTGGYFLLPDPFITGSQHEGQDEVQRYSKRICSERNR